MERCVIFCAGGFDRLMVPIEKTDRVVAADGGYAHVLSLGVTPDAVLGDFDSLGYVPAGAEQFPVEKDDTDAMLAVRWGLAQGCRSFLIYGALDGPRPDHTLASYQTLQFLAEQGAQGYLVGLSYVATVIKDGKIAFPASAKGTVSVFCMGADARGVSISGLKYPLENGTLRAGYPLGVSNSFTGSPAQIRVEQGSLLVLYERENGLSGRYIYG